MLTPFYCVGHVFCKKHLIAISICHC